MTKILVLTALCLCFGTTACVNTQPPPPPKYHAQDLKKPWHFEPHSNYFKHSPMAIYPDYAPEADNPPAYYLLVPIPGSHSTKPPTDGFNKPFLKNH